MRKLVVHQLFVVAVAAMVFFTNLGRARLWDRDEPRNAGCAAEMLQRGDWIVPVFNAELRTHKPVLLYWLMIAAYSVFGVSEFSARLPSAVLGVATVLATYHIGRRLFNSQAALWAALILPSCLMFDVVARAATPDSALIFFTTLALLLYVLGTFPRKGHPGQRPAISEGGGVQGSGFRVQGSAIDHSPLTTHHRPLTTHHPPVTYFPLSWPVVALMYGMMGVAVLAKGPVGLVLPTAVIGMFLLIMRLPPADEGSGFRVQDNASDEKSEPRTLITERCRADGGKLHRWFRWMVGLVRPFAPLHFLRTCWLMRPITALTVALAVALPWYIWVGLRTSGEWIEGFLLTHNVGRTLHPMEGHGGSILYYPVVLMIGFFPWSVFLAPTLIGVAGRIRRHDPWYPGYVFLACWLGVYVGLFSIARTKLPSYITPAYPACALMTGCFIYQWTRGAAVAGRIWPRMALGVLAVAGIGMLIALPLAARRYLPGDEWLGLVGLIPIAGAVGGLVLLQRDRIGSAAATFAVAAVVFTITLLSFASIRVDRHQQSNLLINAIAANSPQPQIASLGVLEPSWVYYARRPIKQFSGGRPWDVKTFLENSEDAFLITTEDQYRMLQPTMPENVTVLATARHFLKEGNLVVIGRGHSVGHVSCPTDGKAAASIARLPAMGNDRRR